MDSSALSCSPDPNRRRRCPAADGEALARSNIAVGGVLVAIHQDRQLPARIDRLIRAGNKDYKLFSRHLLKAYGLAKDANLRELADDVRRGRYEPDEPIQTANFFGIDTNTFAVELAKVTLNIAKKIAFEEGRARRFLHHLTGHYRFFSSLKKGRIKEQIYKNRDLATKDVADYIDGF